MTFPSIDRIVERMNEPEVKFEGGVWVTDMTRVAWRYRSRGKNYPPPFAPNEVFICEECRAGLLAEQYGEQNRSKVRTYCHKCDSCLCGKCADARKHRDWCPDVEKVRVFLERIAMRKNDRNVNPHSVKPTSSKQWWTTSRRAKR